MLETQELSLSVQWQLLRLKKNQKECFEKNKNGADKIGFTFHIFLVTGTNKASKIY